MKQTFKATAALLGIVAAGLLFWFTVSALMWIAYYAGIRM